MRANMIESMDIFIHVVELESFTRAAETLQLHRPAVSKSIQRLEDDLGVKLLHRTTRKLSVTEEGLAFYHRAKQLLGDVNELMASYSPTLAPRGRLRLDTPLSLAHSMLIPALADFQARYPDIDIVLTSTDRRSNLIEEGIDCAIRLGELEDSGLIARHLGNVRMVTCAAPSYLQKHGEPHSLAALERHKAVNFFNAHSREVMPWKFEVNGEMVVYRPAGTILVDNADTFLSCGLAGLGMLQGVCAALSPSLKSGALVEVLSGYTCAPKPVSILYPDRRHLPGKVRVFVDWFNEVFARYHMDPPNCYR